MNSKNKSKDVLARPHVNSIVGLKNENLRAVAHVSGDPVVWNI
jgi:hypothetical protein